MSLTIFNAIAREQLYLQGLKAGQAIVANKVFVELDRDLRRAIGDWPFNELGEMTKAQLAGLVNLLREVARLRLEPYLANTIRFLQEYMNAEEDIVKTIYGEFTEEEPADSNLWPLIWGLPIAANGLLAISFMSGNAGIPASRIAYLANLPAGVKPETAKETAARVDAAVKAATGDKAAKPTPPRSNANTSSTGAVNRIANLAAQGYTNNWNKQQLIEAISGTKAAQNRDGELNRIFRATNAVNNTVIQHVSAQTHYNVAASVFEQYEWCSILDSSTTVICRSRDGKIYVYGQGPVPPAHVGCRSWTIPHIDGQPKPPNNMRDWMREQNADVLKDIYGTDKPTSETSVKAISLKQFKEKKNFFLNP